MTEKLYHCKDIILTHSQMLELKNAGFLQLGIDDTLSSQILNEKEIAPIKTTASAAFKFYSWLAMGAFGYSIYLSFTSNWWWFIVGIFVMQIIWSANKKGGSENVLDAALIDSDFYERVRQLGGWLYKIEESEAEKYI